MTDKKISFRVITPEDECFLYQVYASTRERELALLEWDEKEKDRFLKMQFAAQHQHYQKHFPEARFEIVTFNQHPIGRLYVDYREDEIRIIDIALLPGFRRKGIGTKLLRDLLEKATQDSLPVRIHVEPDNPAMNLYKSLKFQKVLEHGPYILMEWLPESN